jgi:hypothetical protein
MQTHWAETSSHGEMLSVIGLGLDIIGAIVLAFVLFQRFTAHSVGAHVPTMRVTGRLE